MSHKKEKGREQEEAEGRKEKFVQDDSVGKCYLQGRDVRV